MATFISEYFFHVSRTYKHTQPNKKLQSNNSEHNSKKMCMYI
jgi:hypothetical protein